MVVDVVVLVEWEISESGASLGGFGGFGGLRQKKREL
jgi:hypothetical protein